MKRVSELAMTKLDDRAVGLGASIGGLLAARVFADFYRTVTIIERDVLPNEPVNRRGVRRGRHVHALLARGSQVLDELFPGLLNEVVAGGAPVLDGTDQSEAYIFFVGHLFPREGRPKDPTPLFLPSRPLLECLVRQRVRNIPNITMREAHDVGDLTCSGQRNRVTGARVRARDHGAEHVLTADLVVDVTGRGSRTPTFLDHAGYNRAAQDHINVRLTYSSQRLRLPAGALNARIVIISPAPGRPTGMALFGYENATWIVTAIGMAGAASSDRVELVLHSGVTVSSRPRSATVWSTRPETSSLLLRGPRLSAGLLDLRSDLVGHVTGDIRRDHGGALSCEFPAQGAPKAHSATGDDRHLPREVAHVCSPQRPGVARPLTTTRMPAAPKNTASRRPIARPARVKTTRPVRLPIACSLSSSSPLAATLTGRSGHK